MENLSIFSRCEDNSCCCLSPRGSVALISIICLCSCLFDALSSENTEPCCAVQEHVDCMRNLLFTLFQMANTISLLGAITESALLLRIYIWYMLGFVLMGLIVALLDFMYRVKCEGLSSCGTFVSEVAFLFVIYRCLPLVDSYKKRLEGG